MTAIIETFGEAIKSWANPSLPVGQRLTAGWPVMSLTAALSWCGVYAVVVIYGHVMMRQQMPAILKARKEKTEVPTFIAPGVEAVLKRFITFYNVVQVLLCGWMMTAALVEAQKVGIAMSTDTVVCNVFNPAGKGIAFVLWVFYLSKILDFFDTVFMVARSKWEQFSFLHVYHHFSIFMTYWLVTSVGYDGDVYYTVVANSFVHLVMYLYYLLTSAGIKPAWGKYVTQMQMAQFVTMNLQAVTILYRGCPYPNPLTAFYLFYIVSLLGLFLAFYNKKYTPTEKKTA